MVARLLLASVSLAQNPKSAGKKESCQQLIAKRERKKKKKKINGSQMTLTDLDIADTVKKDVVTLNITMNDVLAVQVSQTLASLTEKDQLVNLSYICL